jgi:hypothetical protein
MLVVQVAGVVGTLCDGADAVVLMLVRLQGCMQGVEAHVGCT